MDKIFPIVITGEISNNTVIFLIINESPQTIRLYINDKFYSSYDINTLTTRLLVPFVNALVTNNTYTFTTTKDIIISVHKLSNSYNNLVFFSCDMPAADTTHPLINNFASQTGICFHLGDNIYGDKAYNSNDISYKDIYISTWRRWSTLMSNFSHMMIADDHEVRDGFDIKDNEYKYFNNKLVDALTSYNNFQTALQHNITNGYFSKRVDDFTTVYCISRTIINITPLEIIRRWRNEFRDNIIIATSAAPIPLYSKIPYEEIFGSYGWESSDLLELYDLCFDLLESKRVNNIILIGGDLHFGISGIITKGYHKIHLYVSSGISAHPTYVEKILVSSMNGKFTFDKYSIELISRADRNYLSIQLPLREDNPGILVYNDEYWPKSISSYLLEMFYIIKPSINFGMLIDSIKQL